MELTGEDVNTQGEDPRFKHRRLDWDVKGVIAFMAVFGAFALQATLIINHDPSEMPPWVVGLVSAIVAFYFGARTNGNTR